MKIVSALILLLVINLYTHTRLDTLTKEYSGGSVHAIRLMRPQLVKLFSMGYDNLLADLFWLAFVQYIGDLEPRAQDKSADAYAYLDLITQLDPHFVQAYWFSAFIIGSESGRPDIADRIIRRGIDNNQNNWYLPFIAGINQYLFAKNEVAAARYYQMAAKFPDAPKWLGSQAQTLEAQIPSKLKEVNTWATIYNSAQDRMVKQKAREKLVVLLKEVIKEAPTEAIKKRAYFHLSKLGIEKSGVQ